MKRGVNRNICVKNLDRNLKDDDAHAALSEYGHISSLKLVVNKLAHKQNFAYVLYKSTEDAHRALSEGSGRSIGDFQITLEMYKIHTPVDEIKRLVDYLYISGRNTVKFCLDAPNKLIRKRTRSKKK